MNSFSDSVYLVVQAIPRGKILSYKQVAYRAGKPRAYRAVGNILSKNHNKRIPCHRVVRSDDKLGGYNGGARKKRNLLLNEGALKL